MEAQTVKDRISNDFAFHKASDDTISRKFVDVRRLTKELANFYATACPAGRELSTALTKLEEAMFWANAAIARTQPVDRPTEN